MSSPSLPLTERQRQALRSIVLHIDRNGVAPSVVELSATLGQSHATAANTELMALERKGYISRRVGVARSIVVLRDEDGAEIGGLDEAA